MAWPGVRGLCEAQRPPTLTRPWQTSTLGRQRVAIAFESARAVGFISLTGQMTAYVASDQLQVGESDVEAR